VYSFSPATGGAVAYVAHVFGFLAGALVGLVVRAVSAGQRPAPLP
jgi:membrane associated rhomboid family serine protease